MRVTRISLSGFLFSGLSLLLLFAAAFGYRLERTIDLGIPVGILLNTIVIIRVKKFSFPPYFFLYAFYTAAVGWQLLTIGNPFAWAKYFSLTLSFGLLWTAVYAAGSDRELRTISRAVSLYLFPSAVFFTILAVLYASLRGVTDLPNLVYGIVDVFDDRHHHIGLWWAMAFITVWEGWNSKRLRPMTAAVFMIVGAAVIAAARARSAVLGAAIGILTQIPPGKNYRLKRVTALAAGVLGIATVGLGKSWTSSAGYITQAVMAWRDNPAGYGFGNYLGITTQYIGHFRSAEYVTPLVHNVLLEAFIGMGWWAWLYASWFILTIFRLLRSKRNNSAFTGIFLALSAALMVDPAYLMPVFVWLWAISLGIAQWQEEPGNLQTAPH